MTATHSPNTSGTHTRRPCCRFSLLKSLGTLILAASLTACADLALDRAPASPNTPWQPAAGRPQVVGGIDERSKGFSVPAVPALGQITPSKDIDPNKPLSLPELIDIAQREHPETRQAWNRARQAALAVGMVEATFLPMLSANVVGGYQRTRHPLPYKIADVSAIDTELSGVVPALALGWLLFDFGQREALRDAAAELSLAQNVLFNAAHQKIIRDVTDQYYQYNTARMRVQLTQEALANQQQVEKAVLAKRKAGMATEVELALARQAVSQAKLRTVESQGLERNTWLALLGALGLSPMTKITIAGPAPRDLPARIDPLTTEVIQQALTRRPDLVAGYSAVKAARAGITAAEADFLPKMWLGAIAAHNKVTFDVVGLPGLSQASTSRGVLVGVSLPLFDGGLRSARVQEARMRAENAQSSLETQQKNAVREIVAAESLLHTTLQSAQAAQELVTTAQTAHNAAMTAYKVGMGTVTLATETASQLLTARQAYTDAWNASLVAAANLAFVMGQMTGPREGWLP